MPSVFFLSLMNGAAWGGSEELWFKTALYALERGWKVGVAVYSWEEKEEKMKQLEKAGAQVFYFPVPGNRKGLLQKIYKKLNKRRIRKIANALPINEYDIAVVNLGLYEIILTTWRKFYKRLDRFVILYHNYTPGIILKPVRARAFQTWADRASLNLFASRKIPETLESSGVKFRDRDLLLNPISFPTPSQPSPFPPLVNGCYRFVALTALDLQRKAQDRLIIALSSEHWKSRNWVLEIYGEGRDRKKLEELIRERQMENKIYLKGQTNEVKPVLEGAHLLLQITHMDAMPLAVVEAMAVGRPVIVSQVGDMPYWVTEGENGWISEDASIEEIDHTMERAWTKNLGWEAAGKKAFEVFRQKFPACPEDELLKNLETILQT